MKQFQKVPVIKPQTNVFDLSHEKKLSCGFGELIPIYVQEVLPGDMFSVNTELVVRLAPLVFPLQHRVNVFTHYFFVPNRIIWQHWEGFITGGKDNTDASVHPYTRIDNTNKGWFYRGTLADYLGLPATDGLTINAGCEININALPFKAYQQIYNDYYRDPVLDSEVDYKTGDGSNGGGSYSDNCSLRTRCWEKDYFTSALPYAQQGSATVELPIEGSVIPNYLNTTNVVRAADGGTPANPQNIQTTSLHQAETAVAGQELRFENLTNPQTVDFTGVDIEDLRTAIKLQEWLEKNARGGWRYIDQMLSHFGVVSKDSRL